MPWRVRPASLEQVPRHEGLQPKAWSLFRATCMHMESVRTPPAENQGSGLRVEDPKAHVLPQELEAAAMRASREWEVLQRGTASLTHLLDKFRADRDAAAYAKMVVGTFRGARSRAQ